MNTFEYIFLIGQEDIDSNKHLNNVVYVQWMQDIAVMHSDDLGWDLKRYIETSTTWVVRSHAIHYRQSAFLGEQVTVKTWVESIGRATSTRAYEFFNQSGKLIADAKTEWVFVNTKTNRPASVPMEVKNAFLPLCSAVK
jgi:acyl-CoA thioester hydrolase